MITHARPGAVQRSWVLLLGGALLALTMASRRAEAQLSPGPLARAHRTLEGASQCVQCHGAGRDGMTQRCSSCHADIGSLQQQRRGYHGRDPKASRMPCASCHPDHAGVDFAMIEWPGGAVAKFDHRQAGWPLTGAHLEAKCTACHATQFRTDAVTAQSRRKTTAGWVGLQTTCVSCHRDDDAHKGDLKGRCESCHDTKGWTPAPSFDHDSSAYPLTGAHVEVQCEKCHITPRLPVRMNAAGERVGLFRPVPFAECSNCHADPHQGALGRTCSTCHVTRSFASINRTSFDHQATDYPLRGRHASVSCEGCHGRNLANRTPAFSTCGSCHADPHPSDGSTSTVRADCATCHTVAGFSPSTFTIARHQQTHYPLDGRHVAVACARCHVTPRAPQRARTSPVQAARLQLSSTTCASCHGDAHRGELAAREDRGACESCHTTGGFTPSTFAAAAHARLRVTLEGRHGRVPCAACHGPQRQGLPPLSVARTSEARVTLALRETECASCHVDPHAGRYAPSGAQPIANGCGACHTASQWRPARVTTALHDTFSYPLEGAHRAVPCVACHVELGARQASSTLQLNARGIAALPFTARRATACATCHESPHGTQFAARKDGGRCEGCHVVASFAPASAFNHDRDASFALAGAHVKVPCASCHRAPAGGGVTVYRPLSGTCESCHAAARKVRS